MKKEVFPDIWESSVRPYEVEKLLFLGSFTRTFESPAITLPACLKGYSLMTFFMATNDFNIRSIHGYLIFSWMLIYFKIFVFIKSFKFQVFSGLSFY